MSAPVDVLAVMRGAELGYAATGDTGVAKEMAEARAAVAELVEADREYDEARRLYAGLGDPARDDAPAWARVVAARERRAAALAKFGGGK